MLFRTSEGFVRLQDTSGDVLDVVLELFILHGQQESRDLEKMKTHTRMTWLERENIDKQSQTWCLTWHVGQNN